MILTQLTGVSLSTRSHCWPPRSRVRSVSSRLRSRDSNTTRATSPHSTSILKATIYTTCGRAGLGIGLSTVKRHTTAGTVFLAPVANFTSPSNTSRCLAPRLSQPATFRCIPGSATSVPIQIQWSLQLLEPESVRILDTHVTEGPGRTITQQG